jgi:hypothetical protein
VHTRAAGVTDLGDHDVRLMKRRECHCLRGRCDEGNRHKPDHDFSPIFSFMA